MHNNRTVARDASLGTSELEVSCESLNEADGGVVAGGGLPGDTTSFCCSSCPVELVLLEYREIEWQEHQQNQIQG